ncbi:hypothetical protein [Streptomyces sp. NPDC088752]|uniref:hypothetical protein n=1 Tax=Streptomyces sp. NPDC088752 TaxID=3154963 RepID=UPI00342F497A
MTPAIWSYILTFVGSIGLLVAGRKQKAGWVIGFLAQGLWAAYAVKTDQPGFLISSFIYGFVYARNWWGWRKAEIEAAKGKTEDQRLLDLAIEMLKIASPNAPLADRARYADVLVKFSKTAVAWEEQTGKVKIPRQRRR